MSHEAPSQLWPLSKKAAIFDFDGTLADTAYIWHEVDLTFLGRRSLTPTKDYAERLAALGFADGARYTIELYGLNESVEQICDEWNRLGAELYCEQVVLRKGAERYVRALQGAGIPCALATTNNRDVLGSMHHVQVEELFDACVYGTDVTRGKDHPDIYLEAAHRLGTKASDCVVFEDIAPALASARRAGMLACGVRANDHKQPVDQLRCMADVWLDHWTDIAL